MRSAPLCTADDTEEIITKYADMVYRLAWAYVRSKPDADDVFQEVFLRYHKRAPVFESEEHRKAWLLRVTINRAKSLLSRRFLRRIELKDDAVPFTAPEELELHEALNALPPKYRTVIHLFYFEDCTAEEIGALLGEKPSTVRTQLTRARRQLASLLDVPEERNERYELP